MTTTSSHEGARSDSSDRAPDAVSRQSAGEPLLQLKNVNKSFGSVKALTNINLTIPHNSVTALVGDNGAGKSTLIKAISGISEVDSGEILWKGKPVSIKTPKDSTELGIATVFQDLALCDNLDIVQNIFLGREVTKHFVLNEGEMERRAKQALADLSVVTVKSIRQLVGSLSGGQRQAVAVAKAAMWNAELVIMDEPTAALGVSQTALVLDLIKKLAERGVSVIVISHNLTDVFAVADRIAVMYLGQIAAEAPIAEFDTQIAVEVITTGNAANLKKTAATSASRP